MSSLKPPPFFDLLSPLDQEKYHAMHISFMSEKRRYQRGHRTVLFEDTLQEVRDFCERSDQDDWKRYLVCGICWTKRSLAINVRQFKLLVEKSKSNINGVLSKLGYVLEPSKNHGIPDLVERIPFLKGNYLEQRNWTVRVRTSMTPMPIRSEDFDVMADSQSGSSFASSPEASPPQCSSPGVTYPGQNEMQTLFSIMDLKLKGSRECEKVSNLLYPESFNFFADPICCAQVDWLGSNAAEMMTFG